MGDYTPMAAYYDVIMTSGYYDYDAIVAELARQDDVRTVLELGVGTGLVLERLLARRPDLAPAGVDLTQAMLDVAARRLAAHPQVTLHRQDVTALCLGRRFDLAFSYGGVWYFVPAPEGYQLISHLRSEEANIEALQRVAEHLVPGRRLLLGVQAPHQDYATPVAGGLRYSQRVAPIDGGFRKHYRLDDGPAAGSRPASVEPAPLMEQTTDYRTYEFAEALDLLDKAGFAYQEPVTGEAGLFLEFERR